MRLNTNQYVPVESATIACSMLSVRSLAMLIANADVYSAVSAQTIVARYGITGIALDATNWSDNKSDFFKWFRAEASMRSDSKEYSANQSAINRIFNKSYGGNKPASETTSIVADPSNEATSIAADPSNNENRVLEAIALLKSLGYSIYQGTIEI